MPYIRSSPWMDAANVGQGLGNTWAEIMLQLPMMRQQMAMQQAHLELQRQQMQQAGGFEQQRLANEGRRIGFEETEAKARTAAAEEKTSSSKRQGELAKLIGQKRQAAVMPAPPMPQMGLPSFVDPGGAAASTMQMGEVGRRQVERQQTLAELAGALAEYDPSSLIKNEHIPANTMVQDPITKQYTGQGMIQLAPQETSFSPTGQTTMNPNFRTTQNTQLGYNTIGQLYSHLVTMGKGNSSLGLTLKALLERQAGKMLSPTGGPGPASPSTPGGPPASGGDFTKAVNPATGETIYFVNGQWQKLQ